MLRWLGTRWQTALVVTLFLGSLAVLLFGSLSLLPRREKEVRERLAGAAGRLAEATAPVVTHLSDDRLPESDLDVRLADVMARALADEPGVEGGVYLGPPADRFAGYAFPTSPHPAPPGPIRRDPPPLEAPYIRLQALESLGRGPEEGPLVQGSDIGPSHVVVATAPIGACRPARAVAWVMARVVGPEQQTEQAHRYWVSAALALGGILLALGLTVHLGRSVRRERARQEQLREELRRAEHLASLGRLLAGVAHEVRNPLAGIRSTLQLWQRLPEQAKAPASLDALLGAVDRLEGLVSRLLYFARGGQENRRPVDLNALVRETATLLAARAEAQGVSWELDLDLKLPTVPGSPQALHQVVLNLATNALQAMPAGGRCCCRTRSLDGGRLAELRVADSGPGVPEGARAHLFEPFFTTRPEGTGLGLALCREIVLQHGGTIGLESGLLTPNPSPPKRGRGEKEQAPLPSGERGWGEGAVFRVALPTVNTEKEDRP